MPPKTCLSCHLYDKPIYIACIPAIFCTCFSLPTLQYSLCLSSWNLLYCGAPSAIYSWFCPQICLWSLQTPTPTPAQGCVVCIFLYTYIYLCNYVHVLFFHDSETKIEIKKWKSTLESLKVRCIIECFKECFDMRAVVFVFLERVCHEIKLTMQRNYLVQ